MALTSARGQPTRGKVRRTSNACVACRQSKIKCSGEEPCANCKRRLMNCRFEEPGHKVLVEESYLQELQQKAQVQQQNTPAAKRSAGSALGENSEANKAVCLGPDSVPQPPPIDHTRSIWISPFTLPSTIVKDRSEGRRNWIWLAPSSLWSFTARLKLMMTEKLHLNPLDDTVGLLEGDVYSLQWRHNSVNGPPDTSGLPSIDQALYLFNTVKFHLGQVYRFFDDKMFLKNVHEFYYGRPLEKATACSLWYVQFLLVLAFGNAFLSRSRDTHEPPGAKFFERAVALMPELTYLWRDSLLAIEVTAMIALYLYSVDYRESAHVYVGQAIRIAQIEGLHTQLPEEELDAQTLMRCRNLWWTLYIMDRHFSSSIGLPVIIKDYDTTTLVDPPDSCAQQDVTLSLQVKISQLLSTILTTIYKTERTQLGTFLEQTRSILHTMAGYAQEIEKIIQLKFPNSLDTMPRGTRHITLSYHQCVVYATRPLLLSVLKERLGRLDKLDYEEENWQSLLNPTKALIQTGVKSAVKTLQILSDEDGLLGEQNPRQQCTLKKETPANLSEVFLPFELEFTYGAAIFLTMTRTLFPHVADGEACSNSAHSILNEMISKGNKLAQVRKSDLIQIESLFGELSSQIERHGLQTLTLSTPENEYPDTYQADQGIPSVPTPQSLALLGTGDSGFSASALEQDTRNLDILDNIGISSYEFFSIVDQMENQDNFSILDSVSM